MCFKMVVAGFHITYNLTSEYFGKFIGLWIGFYTKNKIKWYQLQKLLNGCDNVVKNRWCHLEWFENWLHGKLKGKIDFVTKVN